MAQPTNLYDKYDITGIREDLANVIYNIAPFDTPVLSSIEKVEAANTLHEWQVDTLAAASAANAAIEGNDATLDAQTATTRYGNQTQIFDKVIGVSGTAEAVKRAGRKSELGYLLAKAGKEIKTDVEAAILDNGARVVGNATLARELAGFVAWVKTNIDMGSGGANPTGDGTDTRTNGTQRAFTEAQLKAALALCYTNGADPKMAVVGAFNKQVASTFSGGASRFDKAEDEVLHAAYEVYVSDFGRIKLVPDRFSRTRDCLLVDPEYLAIAELRPLDVYDLAKTGDSMRKQMIWELTLEMRNEKAHGGVFDLTTS